MKSLLQSYINRVSWRREQLPARPTRTSIEMRPPSHQNAVDLIPGWSHAFPEQYAIHAGQVALHNDPRIAWAIERFGDLAGKRVLELGPLEGFHSAMLERQSPAVLDSIEANIGAYLRCLVTKQVLDLSRAHFHLGNFVHWLERDDVRYDFILASGVLYHMRNPIRLLNLIAQRTDAVYLWTHYWDDAAMPPDDPRGAPLVKNVRTVRFGKANLRLRARHYYGAEQNPRFCGGPEDLHYWMEKNSILDILSELRFDKIEVGHDHPDHPNGPAFSIFAYRDESARHETCSPPVVDR
jgi:hypothetical protein